MKQLARIQAFEYGSLYTRENEQGEYLTPSQFEKLTTFNFQNGNKYFTLIPKGIKFCQYVGVIQVGRTTIEILPKIYKEQYDDAQKKHWQNVLWNMLNECRKLKRELVSDARLKRREHSLLDLYIEMFLDEVERIVSLGLAKQYVRKQTQSLACKGKILFQKHIISNHIHKERFFVEHDAYAPDIVLNQILKFALLRIDKLSCSTDLKARAKRLTIYFQHISDKRIEQSSFKKLSFKGRRKEYIEAIDIAKIIIFNFSPDIKAGSENLIALMFDMNQIWQEYILARLKRTAIAGVHVSKASMKFWDNQTINPDIVIKQIVAGGEKCHIIDTKWKVVEQAKPSAPDLKQMFAYNIHWKCTKSILLYPKTEKSPDNKLGKYYAGLPGDHGCEIAFVSLVEEDGSFNKNCTDAVWKLLA